MDEIASGAFRLPEVSDPAEAARRRRSDRAGRAAAVAGAGAVLDRLIALSTLLEGHADHVMDAVGPAVVPSVGTIRSRFTARRRGGGLLDRILRTLLGVDAKIRQYAEGAAFTEHVVGRGRA